MNPSLHFRRCHICGTLNEKLGERVVKCSHCEKAFAPFYYFNEKLASTPAEFMERAPLAEGEYSPIQGVTVYWDDD